MRCRWQLSPSVISPPKDSRTVRGYDPSAGRALRAAPGLSRTTTAKGSGLAAAIGCRAREAIRGDWDHAWSQAQVLRGDPSGKVLDRLLRLNLKTGVAAAELAIHVI